MKKLHEEQTDTSKRENKRPSQGDTREREQENHRREK